MKKVRLEASVVAVAVIVMVIAFVYFEPEMALARAEQRWDASGIDSYRMVVSRVNGWNGQRWLVEVDGDVVRGGYLVDGEPRPSDEELRPADGLPTIGDIYQDARRWLAEHRSLLMRSSVDLQLDDDGVPARIHVSGLVSEDAEVTWTIERFDAG